jgi:hypothetical protein
MSVICNCSVGGGNTGTPSCYGIFDVTVQIILVEYYKADGTVNGIDVSTLSAGGTILSQSDLDALIRNVDSKERYYPSPSLKNIVDERADDITESYEDGTTSFIQEGARTFEGLIIKGDPVLLGNLKQWRCVTTGVFFIDKSGNLIGNGKRAGFLDPILLEEETFSAGLIKGSDTTKQKDRIRFTVSSLENDSDLRMIEAGSITAQLIGAKGLMDVIAGTPSAVSTTGFTVQLNTKYGGVIKKIPASGLAVTDFLVFNQTASANVVPVSVTENPAVPGEYAFVLPAQTSLDILLVSNPAVGPLATRYDLESFTVSIP